MTEATRNTDIHVAIVEDDARYRESLVTLFTHSPGYDVAAVFGSASAAVEAARDDAARDDAAWDVILMDIDLGERVTGIEATSRIKEVMPAVKIIMVTVFEDSTAILQAICAGADGYMLKKSSAKDLRAQVRAVVDGASPLTAGVARTVLDLVRTLGADKAEAATAPTRLNLTEREQDVLRCLVQGNSYKQVADQLEVRIDTVRSHIRNLYKKLQVNSAAEAVSRALREGLV